MRQSSGPAKYENLAQIIKWERSRIGKSMALVMDSRDLQTYLTYCEAHPGQVASAKILKKRGSAVGFCGWGVAASSENSTNYRTYADAPAMAAKRGNKSPVLHRRTRLVTREGMTLHNR